METFMLVASIWLGANNYPYYEKRITPDLGELQCKLMSMQIGDSRGQDAWCEIQGRTEPEPERRTPICANCGAIPGRKPRHRYGSSAQTQDGSPPISYLCTVG